MNKRLSLIFVVCIVAATIIARRSLPRRNSEEPGNRTRLGELRSAISMYYGDTAGKYPTSLQDLIPKYDTVIPTLSGLPHSASNEVDAEPADTGHWYYDKNPHSPTFGQVLINCTHEDSAGRRWSGY